MANRRLSIGEVAERTGIAASALRYYEAEGLIPAAGRIGGRRVYADSILGRLAIIQLAKRAGFSLAETRKLVAGFSRKTPPGKRWLALAGDKRRELDARIAEAEQMKRILDATTACECPSFEACADEIRAAGIDFGAEPEADSRP